MDKLIKKGFNQKDIVSFGNMFLLGNGRYGYRGTLEEYRKDEMVGLNMLGVYDRYKDKWRESVNLVNPFYILASSNKEFSLLKETPVSHEVTLDIENGLFNRLTKFDEVEIKSERFVSQAEKDVLAERFILKANKGLNINVTFGMDLDIFEINGPHFKDKKCNREGQVIDFIGTTNEGKNLGISAKYSLSKGKITEFNEDSIFGYKLNAELKKGEELVIEIVAQVNGKDHLNLEFDKLLDAHKKAFSKLWDDARVELIGDKIAQFELDYSIYHLLILEDNSSFASVPARGLSGQTYKGAIFWDTEMFIMPFYCLTNPSFARNTLIYRINTLNGAKQKARKYGFDGAFYAWESQEDGVEQCSDYNVTDPNTNKPIRTYFADKQIHISGDVAFAFQRYIENTGDESILKDGGYEVIYECIKFYLSFMKKNGKYHFYDVLGPDEYHERVNDNAFTNMLVNNILLLGIKYFDKYIDTVKEQTITKEKMIDVANNLFIPQPNEEGIIEQFDGYSKLEDILPNEVIKRKKNPKEYMGGEKGVASKTKVIKQADVLAELVMLNHDYDLEILKKNFEYYYKFTEHGSSLSAPIYSLAASKLGKMDEAYELFRKSSGIDLGTNQKMYAGGIYIGGTHPASNAGAYLSAILGFAGLKVNEEGFTFSENLPPSIEQMKFKFFNKGKQYLVDVTRNNVNIKEVTSND
jgi:trehalose/maltose hydrolase-like predicted phosphorylase